MMTTGTARQDATTVWTPNLKRISTVTLTSCVGLLIGIAGASEPIASLSASWAASQPEQSKASPEATEIDSAANPIRSGQIVVRTSDAAALRAAISRVSGQVSGVSIVRQLDDNGEVFLVSTPDASSALRVRAMLSAESTTQHIQLDRSQLSESRRRLIEKLQRASLSSPLFAPPRSSWPGEPLPDDLSGPRGVTVDPQFGAQWHFINNHVVNAFFDPTDRDNNIPTTIYDTDGLSGAGVTLGLNNQGLNTHIDTNHTELANNFRPDLSMPFDPTTPDSGVMTSLAGIMSAELNGASVQGIAPGSNFGTYKWSTAPDDTPLLEFNAYSWKTPYIDIKLFDPQLTYFAFPWESYNPNTAQSYVLDAMKNSINHGRQKLGVINIFGAGINALAIIDGAGLPIPKLPDPYNFPKDPAESAFSPTDAWGANQNEIAISVTNAWTSGPFYPNGQVTYYPPANDRRTFIFNTVAEDGNVDIYSAQGPSIFASFYGGTTNQVQASGGQAESGQGVLTALPGGGNFGFFPASIAASTNSNMSGAAIGAGVIALMLEVNPSLTIRDIQHILFESIQDSAKAPEVKWPNFDITRAYYFPYAGDPAFAPRRSFWQVNSGLYSSDTVTNQAVRHSDQYGFGMVDADVAIRKARTWRHVAPLVQLDTGSVETGIEVPSPEFLPPAPEPDGSLGIDGFTTFVTTATPFPVICVRQNIQIEAVELELTITGGPSNDLYIAMVSPNGTRSIVLIPTTLNQFGTSFDNFSGDDDTDQNFGGVVTGTETYSLFRHTFLSWKHWGELSAGEWTFSIVDYGVDDNNPEGEEPDVDPMGDPGADMIIGLGELGLPGSASVFRSQHVITGYRFRIYGTDIGAPNFDGCNPFTTSCPADLDGNGIIAVADLQMYIEWYVTGNALADLDGDGDVDYNDLLAYRGIWTPGPCNPGAPYTGGGSPGTDAGGDHPVVRPI